MKFRNYRLLLFVLLFLLNNFAFSQEIISGKILNAQTNEPLAFATIVFNQNRSLITLSDIDGRFSFQAQIPIKSLTIRYLGYETKLISDFSENPLLIKLNPSLNKLEEVIIRAGKNPANGLMQKVIANKARNNPNNIPSFRYYSYNKTIFDVADKDSLKLFQNSHLFLMESVTKRTYKKPDLSEEVVLGTKISGLKNPKFAALATEFQPFSFYNDIIQLYEVNYLNPISNGALKNYQFQLKDTLFKAQDSVFVIAFKPLPNKNFQGMKGTLYINSNGYAIQNVIASPSEKGKINIRIQQQYKFVNNKHWFPEQLNYDLVFEGTEEVGDELIVEGKSYIDRIQFDLKIKRSDFSLQNLHLAKDAGKKQAPFWGNYRQKPLDSVELKTYRVMDSLGKEYHFDRYLKLMSGVLSGSIPISFVDLNLTKILGYNDYEGLRLGAGFLTNEKLFEKVSLGTFFGYGLKDQKWKFGGKIIFHPSNRFSVTSGYKNDLTEAGKYPSESQNIFNVRQFIASRFDNTKGYFLKFDFLPSRYLSAKIAFSQRKVIPKYAYQFLGKNNNFTTYHHTSLTIDLRYAYAEKTMDVLGQTVKLKSEKYPVLTFSYTHGFKDVFKSNFEYNKIEMGIEQKFHIRGLGNSKYKLETGFIDKPVPYGLLFTGKGSLDPDFQIMMKDYFQTMFPYEFLSNRTMKIFLEQDFGTLLFKSGNFQPQIIVHQNMGWGSLAYPEKHSFVNFNTMEEIYIESGLELNNILKINYLNLGYLGFGVASFYRYGFYSLPKFKDNLVLKATVGFTIK